VVSINMCTSHQQHTAIRFRGPVTHACSDNIWWQTNSWV